MVVPKCTSAAFWPLLWSCERQNFSHFIKEHVEYVKPCNFIVAGSHKNSIFASDRLTFNVLVFRVDFK